MKRTRKLLALMLVLCLAASFAACGKNPDAASAEDPKTGNDPARIEINYSAVLMVTGNGEAWLMNKDHADDPWLAAQNVKSAFLGSTGTRPTVDYIDKNGSFFSNSVNLINGGVYDNQLRYENVDQIVPIMEFAIYLGTDGKVYIDKPAASFSNKTMAYGGTTELHDHEPVADHAKTVVSVMYKGAYLNDQGELWCLEDDEWKLLRDNVAAVCQSTSVAPMVLQKDGTLSWTTGSEHTVAFDEHVDEIFENTDVYRKGDRFYRMSSDYSDRTGVMPYQIDNIKTPLWNAGDVLIYIGTDGMIHCTKVSRVEQNGDWVLSAYYDAACPVSTDSIAKIYNFLENEDDIRPDGD